MPPASRVKCLRASDGPSKIVTVLRASFFQFTDLIQKLKEIVNIAIFRKECI
jgi:hypothetical protein